MATYRERPVNPTVHLPEEGTYYYRTFWGSYKGHVMGMLRGTLLGGVIGAPIGAAFFGAMALAGAPIAIGFGAFVAGIAALGAITGGRALGSIGFSAGAAAAATAEEELRLRYPGSGDGTAQSPDSPLSGDGHHYETPPDRDKGKWFHLELGLPMMAVGIAVGGLMAVAALGALAPGVGAVAMFGLEGDALAGVLGTALPFLGGIFGLSYGVDRARFKDLFNHTDQWSSGKLLRTGSEQSAEQNLSPELTKEAAEGKAKPTITTIERQDEHHRLFYDYFERCYAAGTSGTYKGYVGGPLIGGAVGAAFGALAFLIPTLATGGIAPVVMALAAALGAEEGMSIFARSGTEAGTQSAARELLEVKRQRLQKGLDPELEPQDKEKNGAAFRLKPAIICGLVGIAVGIALAPVMGHFLIATLISEAAAAHMVGLGVAASAIMGGLVGTTWGIGTPVIRAFSHVSDAIYDGRILKGDVAPHHEGRNVPYLAPNSPWVPRDSAMQKTTDQFTVPVPEHRMVMMTQPEAGINSNTMQDLAQAAQMRGAEDSRQALPQEKRPTTKEPEYPASEPLNTRLRHIIESRKPEDKGSAVAREDARRMASAMAEPTLGTGQIV